MYMALLEAGNETSVHKRAYKTTAEDINWLRQPSSSKTSN